MKSFKLIGVLLGALVMAGALAGSALAGAAKTGKTAVRTVVHFPVNGPGGEASGKCFWGTSYTQETRNIIWPDSHTDYPVSIDTIPAGGRIVLARTVPAGAVLLAHDVLDARALSAAIYTTSAIKPDPGSTNPFLPGANRNATHRSYTVTVLDQPDPGPGHEAAERPLRWRRRPGPGRRAAADRRARVSPRPRARLLGWRRRARRELCHGGRNGLHRAIRVHSTVDQGRRVQSDRS